MLYLKKTHIFNIVCKFFEPLSRAVSPLPGNVLKITDVQFVTQREKEL